MTWLANWGQLIQILLQAVVLIVAIRNARPVKSNGSPSIGKIGALLAIAAMCALQVRWPQFWWVWLPCSLVLLLLLLFRTSKDPFRRKAPYLTYSGIRSWGNWLLAKKPHNLQVAEIKNSRVSVENRARHVRADITYSHDDGERIKMRKVPWMESTAPMSHETALDVNETQELVILTQRADGRVFTSIDSGGTHELLRIGHWRMRVIVAADNCLPLILEGGFTVLDQNRFIYDTPALKPRPPWFKWIG